MKETVKQRMELFCTAAMQVCFVAMNITFISKALILPMIITGFLISLIWTFNVKKVAFGNWYDRITYASGAALGTLAGFYISHYLAKLII